MIAVYILIGILVILFLWYRHIVRKHEFYNSLKPGDKLVLVHPGGPDAYEIVYVEDKQGDQILLSNNIKNKKGWIYSEDFLFGTENYYSYEDWYNAHHI